MLVLDMEFMKFGTFPRKPLLVMNSLPCISRTPTLVVLTVFHLELSPEMWPLLVTEEVSGSVLLLKLTVYVWWYSHPWGSRSGAFSLPPLGGLTGVSGCPCGSLPQSAVATITCVLVHVREVSQEGTDLTGLVRLSSTAVHSGWPQCIWVCRYLVLALGEPALGMFHKVVSIWYAFIILIIYLFV